MARNTKGSGHEGFDDSCELEGDDALSRSARKRVSHGLRRLGEELATLKPERLVALPLPEPLQDAIAGAQVEELRCAPPPDTVRRQASASSTRNLWPRFARRSAATDGATLAG